jgi:hypothetical protein
MAYKNFKQIKAIETKNKKKLLEIYPWLTEESGIYVFTRMDERRIYYAYVGQAKHVLTRLAQHLTGYQHIDFSIKKHGFLDFHTNPTGWMVAVYKVKECELDEMERYFIEKFAHKGYQLLNKTAGGQGEGKVQIGEYRPAKGYRDGIAQGRKTMARELGHIIDKHLCVTLKPEKANNKVSQNALDKFNELLKEGENFEKTNSKSYPQSSV